MKSFYENAKKYLPSCVGWNCGICGSCGSCGSCCISCFALARSARVTPPPVKMPLCGTLGSACRVPANLAHATRERNIGNRRAIGAIRVDAGRIRIPAAAEPRADASPEYIGRGEVLFEVFVLVPHVRIENNYGLFLCKPNVFATVIEQSFHSHARRNRVRSRC